MVKKLHGFILDSLLEDFARISNDLSWDVISLILFGEPDIDIPDEDE